MPASTPFLGLYKPGGGSTGLITPDEVVDIDRLNTNSDLIDAFAKSYGPATERNHQLYGPAASLGGVSGMKLGDTYQESDGNKVLWKYDGTNWVTNEGGMYLIRPSSMVNASVNAAGDITPNAGAQNVALDGIFTDRFQVYKIIWNFQLTPAANNRMQFRRAGVSLTNAYANQRYDSSGTSDSHSLVNTTFLDMTTRGGVYQQGEMTLYNTRKTALKLWRAEGTVASPDSAIYGIGGIFTGSDAPIDGIYINNGGGSATFVGTYPNIIKVYGIA